MKYKCQSKGFKQVTSTQGSVVKPIRYDANILKKDSKLIQILNERM